MEGYKKTFFTILSIMCLMAFSCAAKQYESPEGAFKKIPRTWKWISNNSAIFSYTGSYQDKNDFAIEINSIHKASRWKVVNGVSAPEKDFGWSVDMIKMLKHLKRTPNTDRQAEEYTTYPYYSPDSTKIAMVFRSDLYVYNIASDKLIRLTNDGSTTTLNGYASWVYFEEIFGRPTKYKAFWWSPDSKKLAYYKFDNTLVPVFPIYSAKGQEGSLRNTRYPKAGKQNPEVKIGFINLDEVTDKSVVTKGRKFAEIPKTIWANFDYSKDGYFGTPFWGPESEQLFVSREPRIQNTLDVYAVNVSDGEKKHIYNEHYKTWLDWIDGMLFTDKGLYMARSFETGWSQIYFLSYDGETFQRLTDGRNWRINLLRVDKKGRVYFTAERDSDVRKALYVTDANRNVRALTDPKYNVANVKFSPDGKYFIAALSNYQTPTKVWMAETSKLLKSRQTIGMKTPKKAASYLYEVADGKGDTFEETKEQKQFALPELIYITTTDGLKLPGAITYPKDFDPSKKYPVHVDIYGGPDTPLVREFWRQPNEYNQWWSENGIIELVADCRAAGHNGRKGMDMVYKHLNTIELEDFKEWARYLQSLPYVQDEKIGVEGFSFGGTMTSMLLFTASDLFHYGIAGGGVYDWALYDTHYTERFMETPQTNTEGYKGSRALDSVEKYPVNFDNEGDYKLPVKVEPVMLKITHGTADDNVHFQQTLQLIDELHKHDKKFDFMIYPDGKHGYHGYQGRHFLHANRQFWLHYLKDE